MRFQFSRRRLWILVARITRISHIKVVGCAVCTLAWLLWRWREVVYPWSTFQKTLLEASAFLRADDPPEALTALAIRCRAGQDAPGHVFGASLGDSIESSWRLAGSGDCGCADGDRLARYDVRDAALSDFLLFLRGFATHKCCIDRIGRLGVLTASWVARDLWLLDGIDFGHQLRLHVLRLAKNVLRHLNN